MANTHHSTELHVLNWHSFHNETEGDEFVLYIQEGAEPASHDPARAVRITGATPEEAYANAVHHVRGLQQGGHAPGTPGGS